MKSLTIHDIEDGLAARLEREARGSGLSLNKLVQRLLAKALGLGSARVERRKDFEGFCGVWSAREAAAFREANREFERVDPED